MDGRRFELSPSAPHRGLVLWERSTGTGLAWYLPPRWWGATHIVLPNVEDDLLLSGRLRGGRRLLDGDGTPLASIGLSRPARDDVSVHADIDPVAREPGRTAAAIVIALIATLIEALRWAPVSTYGPADDVAWARRAHWWETVLDGSDGHGAGHHGGHSGHGGGHLGGGGGGHHG
jgi:hypothetical protein